MKWSQRDSIHCFERFFDDRLNYGAMLQQVREMIQILYFRIYDNTIKFDCMVGPRPSESLASVVQLIVIKGIS
jgi:hypothetical protein